jgi:hypothetical protein
MSCFRQKLARLSARKDKKKFWTEVRRINRSNSSSVSAVDGVSSSRNIANLFASKFVSVLNTHPSSSHTFLHSSIQSSVTDLHISEAYFSEDDVLQALSRLKANKSDAIGVCSEHLRLASSFISESLATFLHRL